MNLVQLFAADRNKYEFVDVCHYSGTEMAEETSPRERLLLDGSDRQGGGERLALARRDSACFYVCVKHYSSLLFLSLINQHK